jgi:hypothetical protein
VPLPAVTPYLRFTWPVLGIVTLAFIGLTIWLTVRQSVSDDGPISRSEHRQQLIEKQNRQRMLERVHAFWIKGVLEQSLHGAALIALGLKDQPDAIANPWRLVFQQLDQPDHTLPPDTRITPVYDDAGGELLILGDPGSGKTTMLLELARDLLDRAQKDDTLPMPVVFNLSSWAVKRQPLADWLVEELNTKYQVPRKLGQSWVDTDQIQPFLDGLDEVVSEHRSSCVDAINAYRREHGLVPSVVCSRSAEYLIQTRRILLHKAVVLQPLTTQQINNYLASIGECLAAVRAALNNDQVLQELMTTPLMLSVLTLAFHGISVEDLLEIGSSEMQRRQVFEKYVQRMLQRRGDQSQYTRQQTISWLTWLAQQMKLHSQTEFSIERLQPDWLAVSRWRLLYENILLCMHGASIFGGIFGFFGAFSAVRSGGMSGGIIGALTGGMIGGMIGALIGALVAGIGLWVLVIHAPNQEVSSVESIKFPEVITWSSVKNWGKSPLSKLRGGSILTVVCWTLICGLYGMLACWIIGVYDVGINRELHVGQYSLPVLGLVEGLLIGLGIGGSNWLGHHLSIEVLDENNYVRPNQVIWSSVRNSVLVGLFEGLIFGVTLGPAVGVAFSVIFGLSWGLVAGLAFGFGFWLFSGLFFGLSYCGYACIKHAILRLLLLRAGYVPLNYPRFLDYAADRILLRKVGGGYIFIHRLLLEYFASLDTTTKSSGVSEQP